MSDVEWASQSAGYRAARAEHERAAHETVRAGESAVEWRRAVPTGGGTWSTRGVLDLIHEGRGGWRPGRPGRR